nr:hypothetical protein [Tanacetum cinerariifolium]
LKKAQEKDKIRSKRDKNGKCGEARKGPYTPSTVVVPAVPATDDSPAVPEHTTEIWEAIERLQQGESLNIQDVKTNLFWEIARNANLLALVATPQSNQDPYYLTPKPHKPYAPTSKASIPTKPYASTRNKGKEIATSITPPSESVSKKDSDPEQAPRDKDMQKNLALIAKYFKKIYKPTNNKLKTSSNSRNKNVDNTLRYKNDNQSGQFGSQRMVNVARARENVGKQSDWLADTDEEINEQELEAHYNYMAKIQEVPTADSCTDSEPLEQDDSDVTLDSLDMCEHDIQTDQNAKDERDALANLIANLKLNVDENKKI